MSPAAINATITLTSEVENLMGTLCDLLERESDAVQASDFKTFREMQNDKFAMLTRYHSLVDTLKRQTSSFGRTDPVVVERLKASSEKFRKTAARNSRALDDGRNSMQRIVDRIVRCARDTVHANRQSYNKSGATGAGPKSLSIQIDEIL